MRQPLSKRHWVCRATASTSACTKSRNRRSGNRCVAPFRSTRTVRRRRSSFHRLPPRRCSLPTSTTNSRSNRLRSVDGTPLHRQHGCRSTSRGGTVDRWSPAIRHSFSSLEPRRAQAPRQKWAAPSSRFLHPPTRERRLWCRFATATCYHFRCRLADLTGGGPSPGREPFGPALKPVTTTRFRRFVQPKTVRLETNIAPREPEEPTPPVGTVTTIDVRRPLIGYPEMVFAGIDRSGCRRGARRRSGRRLDRPACCWC